MTSSTEPAFAPIAYQHVAGGPAQKALEQARTHGYAAGYSAGLRAAEAETAILRARREEELRADRLHARALIDRAVAILRAAARSLDARVLPVLEGAEEMIAATALDVAEAVLGYELSDVENSARSALVRALNPSTPATVHTVRLHPEDLALLERAGALDADVAFVADPALSPGDAVAEYPQGLVDARIAAALGRARRALVIDGGPGDTP